MTNVTTAAAPQGAAAKRMEPNPSHRRATRILTGKATFDDRFIKNHDELVEVVNALRQSGCAIAFTTGVWDLFHVGHAEYIQKGKEEAAKLYPEADHVIMVVGIDTDELTRERKGPSRPIVPEGERWRVLSHLREVDIITPQYEANTLYRLIPHDVRIISTSTTDLPPDHDDIKAQCEHLVNLPPQAETSTTARIRTLAIDGGVEVFEKVKARLGSAWQAFERELQEIGNELKS